MTDAAVPERVSPETERCQDTHPTEGYQCDRMLNRFGLHDGRHEADRRDRGCVFEWSDDWASETRRKQIGLLETRLREATRESTRLREICREYGYEHEDGLLGFVEHELSTAARLRSRNEEIEKAAREVSDELEAIGSPSLSAALHLRQALSHTSPSTER